MRLVPIESVALVLEVKLAIDATKFKVADGAARDTNELRLAIVRITCPNRLGAQIAEEGRERGPRDGTRVADAFKRIWFGVVAADGPDVETLARPS